MAERSASRRPLDANSDHAAPAWQNRVRRCRRRGVGWSATQIAVRGDSSRWRRGGKGPDDECTTTFVRKARVRLRSDIHRHDSPTSTLFRGRNHQLGRAVRPGRSGGIHRHRRHNLTWHLVKWRRGMIPRRWDRSPSGNFAGARRGEDSAIGVLCVNLPGGGAGPSAVALLTDYSFHSPKAPPLAVALIGTLASPAAFLPMLMALIMSAARSENPPRPDSRDQ